MAAAGGGDARCVGTKLATCTASQAPPTAARQNAGCTLAAWQPSSFTHAVASVPPPQPLLLHQVCKELGKHMGVEVMVSTGGTSLR